MQSLKAEVAPPILPLSKDTCARIQKHIQALDDPVHEVNVRAENRLIRFGAKAVGQVLPILDHSNSMVRLRAGWILGMSKDPRAFEPLCRLMRDPDERVRYDIAVALGHHGDERAIPLLRQAAEDASDCVLSAGAAQGLALFGIDLFPDDE